MATNIELDFVSFMLTSLYEVAYEKHKRYAQGTNLRIEAEYPVSQGRKLDVKKHQEAIIEFTRCYGQSVAEDFIRDVISLIIEEDKHGELGQY